MHPYIAYLILTSPANRDPRPDECCIGLRAWLARLWQRARPGAQGGR